MRLRILFVIAIFTSTPAVYAQTAKKIFYDKNWRVTKIKDSAAYYRVATFDNNGKPEGEVKDYYITGELQAKIDGALIIDSVDDSRSKFIKCNENYYKSGKKSALTVNDNMGNNLSSMGWYETGELWFKASYKNGKRHGIEKYTFPDGTRKAEIAYANGKRNGTSKWYYEDGELKEEATFVNDSINGSDKVYYDGGNVKSSIPFVNGKREGQAKWYYYDGLVQEEAKFANNKIIGSDVYYFENGQILGEIPYVNGEKSGMAKGYYVDGTPRTLTPYLHDKLNGTQKDYFDNGLPRNEATYVDDSLTGTTRNYYNNGKLMKEIPYVNYKIEGTVKTYTDQGKLSAAVDYTKGKLNGNFIMYWGNMQVKRNDKYEKGEFKQGTIYDSNGVELQPYVKLNLDITATQNDEVYTIVEQMPTFSGDVDAWIGEHIQYPETERQHQISGTVYVTFIIEKDGQVDHVRVLKGIEGGDGLEDEAVRVILSMPKWTPGMQGGKAVRVAYNLPIRFLLR